MRLVAMPVAAGPHAPKFSVWALPGKKSLVIDGRGEIHLSTTSMVGVRQWTLDASLLEGDDYAVVIPAGLDLREAQRALAHLLVPAEAAPVPSSPRASGSVNRSAIVHLRSLQAADAVVAGASHRAIAATLFGADEIARRWTPDGELRAQVRYLVRRAQQLCGGGYRALLTDSG